MILILRPALAGEKEAHPTMTMIMPASLTGTRERGTSEAVGGATSGPPAGREKWSGRLDSNQRPWRPKRHALPG